MWALCGGNICSGRRSAGRTRLALLFAIAMVGRIRCARVEVASGPGVKLSPKSQSLEEPNSLFLPTFFHSELACAISYTKARFLDVRFGKAACNPSIFHALQGMCRVLSRETGRHSFQDLIDSSVS